MSIIATIITLLYWFWIKDGGGWNLGFSVVNTVFLMGLWIKKKEIRKDKYLISLWLTGMAIGWFQTWRNFAEVKVVSVMTLMAIGGYLAALGDQPKAIMDLSRIWRSAFKTIPDFFRGIFGLWAKFWGIKLFSRNGGKRWNKTLTGIILAIPMIFVFGSLFYSADPIFAKLVNSIKLPEIKISEKLIYDVLTTLMVFGISLTLANFRLAKKSKKGSEKIMKVAEEITIASGAVAVLFLVFSLIQIRYFWANGESLKEMGIIYSEYTRKGYAEMLLASGLATGLVYWLGRIKDSKIAIKIGVVLIIESIIIVVAATNRNYIYQDIHGFTRVRLAGFLVSGWMAVMLILMAWKVIKRKSDNKFFRIMIGVSAVTVLTANVINIDRMIVKNKLPNLGYDIDYWYVSALSNDAYEIWPWLLDRVDERRAELGGPRRRWVYSNLRFKADRLKKEKANNWARWAGWNGTAVRAEKTMEKLRGRLDAEAKEIVVTDESEK